MLGLRHLGAARTGAYFSLAPFIGALLAIAFLGEPLTARLAVAGVLMGFGLWLHLAGRHQHAHEHEELDHEHSHTHDDHHQHAHDGPATEPHSTGTVIPRCAIRIRTTRICIIGTSTNGHSRTPVISDFYAWVCNIKRIRTM